MCEIGKPLEILNVEPLVHPAPLRRETEQPEEQPTEQPVIVPVEVPVGEPTCKGATVSPVAGTEKTAYPYIY